MVFEVPEDEEKEERLRINPKREVMVELSYTKKCFLWPSIFLHLRGPRAAVEALWGKVMGEEEKEEEEEKE